jgi:hypothetical protein
MTDTFVCRPRVRNDRKLTLLKQVYRRSRACNYAKRYAVGRDITNQSRRLEDSTPVRHPCLVYEARKRGQCRQADTDRIPSRVSPFSF